MKSILVPLLLAQLPSPAQTLDLENGDTPRLRAPIIAEVSDLPDQQTFVAHDGGKLRSAQRIPDTNQVVWMPGHELGRGEKRLYQLAPAEPEKTTAVAEESDDAIVLKIRDKPVLRYVKAVQTGPEGTEPFYARSGHIHPVYDPDGRELTSEFPADHIHQHALFFAWTKCEFEGQPAQFWDQKLQIGRIRHAKVISTTSGPVFAQFVVEISWDQPATGKPVLTETWTVRAYDTGADFFLFDLESVQNCAGDSPLTIQKYHYGGMAIRGADQWFGEGAGFLTNEGKAREEGNHTKPNWVDMFGLIDGKPSGVAVLAHPGNFRFPQHVRLHPSKPYFCYSPMVDEEFQIKPGEPYVSRFRYLVHTGGADAKLIDSQWAQYAEEVKVKTNP